MSAMNRVRPADSPETVALDADARDALPTANALRRSVTLMARRLRGLRPDREISGAKLSLLGHLHRAGRALIAADIARLEGLQPQSLTRIIAELDELGLIRRSPDAFDRRQTLIEITPRGKKLLAGNAIRQNAWLAATMSTHLTAAEREMLHVAAGLLEKLADAGDRAPGDQ